MMDIQNEPSQQLPESQQGATSLCAPHDLNEGGPCPQCRDGLLFYNGLLSLVCGQCSFELIGAYT